MRRSLSTGLSLSLSLDVETPTCPRLRVAKIFGYFYFFLSYVKNGHSSLDVDVARIWRQESESEKERERENLPSVDPLGELVAFQGPPKLTALDISPLHIPRHFHFTRAKRRYSRGATGKRKKSGRDGGGGYHPSTLRAGHNTHSSAKKLGLSLARATSISLFCCHSSVGDRFSRSRGDLPSS